MRTTWIGTLLLLAVSLPLFGQTVEVIAPPTVGEDHTATWTVVLANPGAEATLEQQLHVMVTGSPAFAQLIAVPPGCLTAVNSATCTVAPLAPGERRELPFTARYGTRYGSFTTLAALATVSARADLWVMREFPVTNTNDSGPGSLRQALLDMNQTCTSAIEPCGPAFRIDGPVPAEGWFTIRPSSPLPPIIAVYVIVDGRTQTRHTGDTNPAGPEIMLDGSSAWHHGLQFNGRDGTFTDIAIGNFPGNGIASTGALFTNIQRCHLGMDPSGTRRAPNGSRGVQIEGSFITVADSLLAGNFRSGGWFDTDLFTTIVRNRFTGNGASGLYARITKGFYDSNVAIVEDNVIADNAHAGISLDRASIGSYAKNTFTGNLGRAIDIGIDGPTVAAVPGLPGRGGIIGMPAVTSARYENGETVIEVVTAPHAPIPGAGVTDVVHVYASAVPKDGGELIGIVRTSGTTLRVPRDLRGQWVSAATVAIYSFGLADYIHGTSETSEPRMVE